MMRWFSLGAIGASTALPILSSAQYYSPLQYSPFHARSQWQPTSLWHSFSAQGAHGAGQPLQGLHIDLNTHHAGHAAPVSTFTGASALPSVTFPSREAVGAAPSLTPSLNSAAAIAFPPRSRNENLLPGASSAPMVISFPPRPTTAPAPSPPAVVPMQPPASSFFPREGVALASVAADAAAAAAAESAADAVNNETSAASPKDADIAQKDPIAGGYSHHTAIGSLPGGPVVLAWRLVPEASAVDFALRAPASGYVALAFPSTAGEMVGSEAVVGWLQPLTADGTPTTAAAAAAGAADNASEAIQHVHVYRLVSKSSRAIGSAAVSATAGYLLSAGVSQDAQGRLVLRFRRPLIVPPDVAGGFVDLTPYVTRPATLRTGGIRVLPRAGTAAVTATPSLPVLWAANDRLPLSSTSLGYHGDDRGAASVDLLTGAATPAKPPPPQWLPYAIAAAATGALLLLATGWGRCQARLPLARKLGETRAMAPIAAWAGGVTERDREWKAARARARARGRSGRVRSGASSTRGGATAAGGRRKGVEMIALPYPPSEGSAPPAVTPAKPVTATVTALPGGNTATSGTTISAATNATAPSSLAASDASGSGSSSRGSPGPDAWLPAPSPLYPPLTTTTTPTTAALAASVAAAADARGGGSRSRAEGRSYAGGGGSVGYDTSDGSYAERPRCSRLVKAARALAPDAVAYATVPHVLFLGAVIAILAVFFGTRYAWSPVGSDALRRSLGDTAVLCLGAAAWTPRRQSGTLWLLGVSWEDAIVWHRLLGRTAWVLGAVHFFLGPLRLVDKVAGAVALALLTVTIIVSAAPARRASYSAFYVLHILFAIGALVFAVVHAPFLRTFGILAVPVVLILIDYAFRARDRCRPFTVLSLKPYGTFTELRVRAPKGFTWSAGGAAHLHIPSIDPLLAHPFTIAGAPPHKAGAASAAVAQRGCLRAMRRGDARAPPATVTAPLTGPPRLWGSKLIDGAAVAGGYDCVGENYTIPAAGRRYFFPPHIRALSLLPPLATLAGSSASGPGSVAPGRQGPLSARGLPPKCPKKSPAAVTGGAGLGGVARAMTPAHMPLHPPSGAAHLELPSSAAADHTASRGTGEKASPLPPPAGPPAHIHQSGGSWKADDGPQAVVSRASGGEGDRPKGAARAVQEHSGEENKQSTGDAEPRTSHFDGIPSPIPIDPATIAILAGVPSGASLPRHPSMPGACTSGDFAELNATAPMAGLSDDGASDDDHYGSNDKHSQSNDEDDDDDDCPRRFISAAAPTPVFAAVQRSSISGLAGGTVGATGARGSIHAFRSATTPTVSSAAAATAAAAAAGAAAAAAAAAGEAAVAAAGWGGARDTTPTAGDWLRDGKNGDMGLDYDMGYDHPRSYVNPNSYYGDEDDDDADISGIAAASAVLSGSGGSAAIGSTLPSVDEEEDPSYFRSASRHTGITLTPAAFGSDGTRPKRGRRQWPLLVGAVSSDDDDDDEDEDPDGGPVLTFFIKDMGKGTFTGSLRTLALAMQVQRGSAIRVPAAHSRTLTSNWSVSGTPEGPLPGISEGGSPPTPWHQPLPLPLSLQSASGKTGAKPPTPSGGTWEDDSKAGTRSEGDATAADPPAPPNSLMSGSLDARQKQRQQEQQQGRQRRPSQTTAMTTSAPSLDGSLGPSASGGLSGTLTSGSSDTLVPERIDRVASYTIATAAPAYHALSVAHPRSDAASGSTPGYAASSPGFGPSPAFVSQAAPGPGSQAAAPTLFLAPASRAHAGSDDAVAGRRTVRESASDAFAAVASVCGAGPPRIRVQRPFGGGSRLRAPIACYRNIVLVAGGIGVTPAVAIVQRLFQSMAAARAREVARRAAAIEPASPSTGSAGSPPLPRRDALARSIAESVGRLGAGAGESDWIDSSRLDWGDRRVLLVWAVRDLELLQAVHDKLERFVLPAEGVVDLLSEAGLVGEQQGMCPSRDHPHHHHPQQQQRTRTRASPTAATSSPAFGPSSAAGRPESGRLGARAALSSTPLAAASLRSGPPSSGSGSSSGGEHSSLNGGYASGAVSPLLLTVPLDAPPEAAAAARSLANGGVRAYGCGFIQVLVFYTGTRLWPSSRATPTSAGGSSTARAAAGSVPDLSGVAGTETDELASGAALHAYTDAGRALLKQPTPPPVERGSFSAAGSDWGDRRPSESLGGNIHRAEDQQPPSGRVTPSAPLPPPGAPPAPAGPLMPFLPPADPVPPQFSPVPPSSSDGRLDLSTLFPHALVGPPAEFLGGIDVVVGRPNFAAVLDRFLLSAEVAAVKELQANCDCEHMAGAARGNLGTGAKRVARALGYGQQKGVFGARASETAIYLCGPDALARDVRDAALKRGIPVHAEHFYL